MCSNKAIKRVTGHGAGHPLTVQRGLALVVVMLFLILISGISLVGVKESIFSEHAARNQLDYEVARQAAESALRDAERDLMNPSLTLVPNSSCSRGDTQITEADFTAQCTNGLCRVNESAYAAVDWSKTSGGEVWWPASKGGQWNNQFADKPVRIPATPGNCHFTGAVPLGTYTGAPALKSVARQPEYLVEYFRRKNVRINQVESQVYTAGRNANQWSPMYRITARGFGISAQTQVVVQSIFFP